MSRPPRIAISLGDPCGIGPELLLRSLPTLGTWADVIVVGSRAGLDLLKGTEGRLANWSWADAPAPAPEDFRGIACGLEVESPGGSAVALWLDPTPEIRADHLVLGQGSAASGRATVEAIRVAAGLAMAGAVDALTTLPMAKSAAHLAGYPIPGHTEYLQALAGAPLTRMAFVSPRLSVVLHTVHQSLRSVVEDLDAEAVAETLAFAASRFIQLTGNPDLRVALCALNPHAGEAGAFGDEERLLVEARERAEAAFREAGSAGPFATLPSPFPAEPAPAGWTLHPTEFRAPGSTAGPGGPRFSGPLPSDSLFHRAVSGEFDLVVALYHDQGLIPIKLLEPSRAVNLTLGLPFIRTSPDHGTAFDKAGKWIADPRNFLEAAAMAVRLAGRARQEPWTAQVVGP
ncbi:PdxA family dehydrogenase [Geothrix oryzisoli]|uniref:PdxA family dehydrogenase n=1 Tax=Geothrix oryzisoli TaxID=2922721 RepID=UPI001FAC298A|nr:4-hydroxythreonine-4-phosphate dehydrogenase PdxA [Geothrix oryzisoli]